MFKARGGHLLCKCVGRDVQSKGVQFSESVWDRGIFHCTNSGKGLKYTYLERVPACLERACQVIFA